MALHDVSNDSSLIGWLRQSGHAHLLDEGRLGYAAPMRSASATVLRELPADQHNQFRSPSYSNVAAYQNQHYDYQPSITNVVTSPTQFLAPNVSQHQYDHEIENLRRDPNTRVIHRPNHNDLVYKQRVFVKYLQPPTPPNGGTIIIREKQPPPPPPDPPLIIRRAPPPPPTPPPVVIRERPPPIPPPEGTMIINKFIPPPAKPPRQVIIEQLPQLPPKPRDVILERWLPLPPRQRRIIYERLPPHPPPMPTHPMLIQHAPPRVHVQRQIITQPGVHPSQPMYSTVPTASSLVAYDPYAALQPTYSSVAPAQPNIVIMQTPQTSNMSSSIYGLPMSYVSQPQVVTGLNAYGSGISTIPTTGQTFCQSTVYNVAENVPVDQVLRQLGIEPYSLQPTTDLHNAVSPVWNVANNAVYPYQSISSSLGSAAAPIQQYLDPLLTGTAQTIPYYP